MGLLNRTPFLLAVLLALGCGSSNRGTPQLSAKPAPVAEVSAADSLAQLQLFLEVPGIESFPEYSLLKSAQNAFATGQLIPARAYLLQFIRANESILPFIEDGRHAQQESRELLRYLAASDPARIRHGFQQVIGRLQDMSWNIYRSSAEQRLDTLATVGRTLAFRRTAMQQRSIQVLHDSFRRLSLAIGTADPERLTAFIDKKGDLFYRLGQALEALASRWGTCEDRALDIASSIDHFIATGRFYSSSREEAQKISGFLEREKDEQIWKEVVFTRENVALGVATAMMVAEVGCAFATGGLCLAAAPGALGTTMTVVRGAARTYAGVTAAADIVDHLRYDGVIGSFSSFGFWVDILVVFATTPRPTLNAMKWAPQIAGAPSLINAGLSHFKPGLMLAMAQHQSGYLLLMGGAGYGWWQWKYAERISRELSRKGVEITPDEVRKKAAVSVALSLVGGLTMYHEYKKGLALYGKEYDELMKPARLGPTMGRVGKRLMKLLPWDPPVSAVRNIREWPQHPVINSFRTLGNVGAAAYDILFWTNLGLLGISYGDWSFATKSDPMPDLQPGEIAVVLNGFADEDLLFYGFANDYSLRREIEKYGDSLHQSRFSTPTEMLDKIREFGKIGRIRYLSIQTHGLPGRLYARAPGPEGGSEYIDVEYLAQHGDQIRALMKASMAPMAHVRLVSCLVGANFKEPTTYNRANGDEISYEKDVGDKFIKAFGETFMANGGTLDSSRRMILGGDALYGTFFNTQLESLMMHPALKNLMESQAESLKLRMLASPQIGLLNSQAGTLSKDQKDEIVGEVLVNIVDHLKSTYGTWKFWHWQIYEVIKVYGLDLEGGPFSDKHRRDRFPVLP